MRPVVYTSVKDVGKAWNSDFEAFAGKDQVPERERLAATGGVVIVLVEGWFIARSFFGVFSTWCRLQ